jgi:spore maturation protein CgeB
VRRILLSTINYDHIQKGIIDAFRKVFGAENVEHFDFLEEERRRVTHQDINHHFLLAAKNFKPDWIFTQFQESNVITGATMAQVRRALPKCVLTTWMGDCRKTVSPYLASVIREVHLTLISSVGQTGMFMEAGAKEVRYLQIGLDWDEDVLGLPAWTPPFRIPNVVFCGGFYGDLYPGTKDRVNGIQALRNAGIDIGIVGNGWPKGYPVIGLCGVKQQHHVWKHAKVCLNINNFNDIQNYYSDRQLIAMASGRPLVCRYIPGLENEFENGKHCLWYYDEAELVGHVRKLLSDPDLSARIGAAGRAEVMKSHSWEARVHDVLSDVERLAATL